MTDKPLNLIIHIGTPKTGTTTIQEALYNNREALRSQGFHFIQSAGRKNNLAFTAYCLNDQRTDRFLNHHPRLTSESQAVFKEQFKSRLYQEISSLGDNIHTAIISSEQLSERLMSVEEVRQLYQLLSPSFSKIRVLGWLREQCDMMGSLYSTLLKSGGTLSFKDFSKQCRPDNDLFNYYQMLERWSLVFGDRSIEVRVFDKRALAQRSLVRDFFSHISPNLAETLDTKSRYRNVSINIFGQLTLLFVNRFIQRYAQAWLKNPEALRRRIVEKVTTHCTGRGFTPSSADFQRIYHAFYESNRMVNERYLGESGELFEFSPPRR